MRMFRLGIALVATLMIVPSLHALHTGGSTVLIPVAGRFAGAGGTQWRTDVFVSNPYAVTQTVTLKFYQSGGAVLPATFSLAPFHSESFPDIVLNKFGLTSAAGTIEVSVPGGLTIEARATIYNSGNPAGQFGQGVPGIDFGYLNRQAFLFGLSGLNGQRVNLGVSNPNDTAAQVQWTLSDAAGATIYSRADTVQPHSYVQFNDIFATFGITPRSGVTANITSDLLIYGYSSEVRNDTGDAIFNFGISPNS